MIAGIRGKLVRVDDGTVCIDAGGLVYEVETSLTTLAALPAAGAAVELHTHLVVREDAHLLYGFLERAERDLFRTLIRINGIGPRLALALQSAMDPARLAMAIAGGDVAALTRVSGVGKRTAERLIVELRDRIGALGGGDAGRPPDFPPPVRDARGEAEEALVALGYRAPDATRMIARVFTADASTEALVRAALRSAGGADA